VRKAYKKLWSQLTTDSECKHWVVSGTPGILLPLLESHAPTILYS